MEVASALEGNWEFRVDHKNIKIFSSKISGSQVLGFKGETVFEASLKKLISIFHDFGSYGKWVHQLAEMEVLHQSDDLDYVVRQVLNTPWPIPKREMIVRTCLHASEEGALALTMTGIPDYAPSRPDVHRVRDAKGVWILMPVEKGKVHVTFVMHLDPGSDIPAALSNAALFEVPFYSLLKMRNLAQDPSYNPAWPSVVDNHITIIEDEPGRH
ncbi:MAG: START domain-containing protein [Chlorobaculum sp.]|nr:START domain-containing protein [Chlorobaculum sp.]